jgi:DNA-binding CsgD family transcriptional regulator
VLLFLGRGYSPAYVAKKMFLSDSTVRSHIKSIYKKLDIHSREDLLQLIENENEPSSMTDF